jgi:glucose/arabinose dehydrogenase
MNTVSSNHAGLQPFPTLGLPAALGLLSALGLCAAACGTLTGLPAGPGPVTQTAPLSASPSTPTDTPFQPATQPAATEPPPAPTGTSTPASPPPTPTVTRVYRTSFPDARGYTWAQVASGLILPVDIQNAGDGSGRLFVVEKRGIIRVIKNGKLLQTPFLDIRSRVDSRGIEQGSLGLAFHPKYASNGLFFVNYIDLNGNTVVASFRVSADDPDRADPASGVDVLNVRQPYSNHNGGGLAFGPDGDLYIGLGDGGSERDPQRTGQNLQTLLGKMLRINVDAGVPYTIPPDNPFAVQGGQPEIWAYGLRNPWRFSFDRATGDLYIGDVGQDAWEEVDYVPAGTAGGMNFGWSYYEGNHPYQDQPPADAIFTSPAAEYSHDYGCALTGGYVYRGAALPEFRGVYLFGDYCTGTVWGLIHSGAQSWQMQVLFETRTKLTTFGVDEAGEVYLVDYDSGSLYRLARR